MLEDDAAMTEANIYIAPPLDPACSDEDSGNVDEGTVNNLTNHQLEAEAKVTVRHGAERVRIAFQENSELNIVTLQMRLLILTVTQILPQPLIHLQPCL